ncbi:MAG TPA: glycosyltransferase, partial [Mycoplana sp.]|nr:glycosyltransferase [Mycoplana sp.]
NGRYPVPLGNKRADDGDRKFDIVFVSDFALKGGAFVSTLNYMKAAALAGLKIAAVHWRKYDLDTDSPLNPLFYDACLEHAVELLTDGDVVSSRHVIVGYPAILQHLPDRLPQISSENVIVLINQFATRLVDGSDRQYEPEVARRHLTTAFGSAGTWIPISHWVKRLMLEDETYPPPHTQPWHPMIDTDAWCAVPVRWRAGGNGRPVLGRHGRDAYTKWPSTIDAIKAAYCVDADVEVRFLGGARHAIGLLGYTPKNWDVQNFNATPVDAFLGGLDFLVHFPHELYIEEFGRTVMEAMAMGKVAILPPQFEETFGEAAVYCEPDEVLETVHRYWTDESVYLAQAAKGRDFVRRHCSQSDFIARLDALTDKSTGRPDAAPWVRPR